MPHEFTVVGEHREDITQLLVLGDDGNYYCYRSAKGRFTHVEPDETWLVFSDGEEPPEASHPEEGNPS